MSDCRGSGEGLRWLWVDVVSIITHHITHDCKGKEGEGDGEKEKTERDQNKQRLNLKHTHTLYNACFQP